MIAACPANELLIQTLKQPADSVQGIEICTDGEGCATRCFDNGDSLIRSISPCAVMYNDKRTFSCEAQCNPSADPPAGSCYNSDFTFQTFHIHVDPLLIIWLMP
ncbi:hypothetical protein D3C74_391770 [compost metagenome]